MHVNRKPDLSIIVPLLNEATELQILFETLAAQEEVSFELLLCDGGSSDATRNIAAELGEQYPFPLRLLDTPSGRGCQMNAGAVAAQADMLLFLHADSRFTEPDALATALHHMTSLPESTRRPVAARFRLRFRRGESTPSLAYYFYEAKAQLDRVDCIRGDQGFLLSRSDFELAGRFDDTLPFLEDIRLAASVSRQGKWMLLPAEITTSARRFENEGLLRRQVVNAIIVNAVVVEWISFFRELPGLYRCHTETGRLLLFPLLDGIRTLLADFPPYRRLSFWQATGGHVAANSWQIFFWLDVRSAFQKSLQPGAVQLLWTNRFNRYLSHVFCSPPVASLAAATVWIWHRGMLLLCRHLEPRITKTS